MLIGQYEHSLEEKGRLQIPKNYRESLYGGAVITKGLDGCLFLYPREKWQALVEKISTLSITKTDARAFSRLLTYGANEVEIDRVGRILIPAYLRDYAQIKTEVVIAGNLDKVEIWDKAKFLDYQTKIEKESSEIAEKLADL
jgi:MraZ protein